MGNISINWKKLAKYQPYSKLSNNLSPQISSQEELVVSFVLAHLKRTKESPTTENLAQGIGKFMFGPKFKLTKSNPRTRGCFKVAETGLDTLQEKGIVGKYDID